jgi:hypothetical protein
LPGSSAHEDAAGRTRVADAGPDALRTPQLVGRAVGQVVGNQRRFVLLEHGPHLRDDFGTVDLRDAGKVDGRAER